MFLRYFDIHKISAGFISTLGIATNTTGVLALTTANAANLSQTLTELRNYLEGCFNTEGSKAGNLNMRLLAKFYEDLADIQEVPLSEVYCQVDQLEKKLQELEVILRQLDGTDKWKLNVSGIFRSIEIVIDIVEQYWEYIPPSGKAVLAKISVRQRNATYQVERSKIWTNFLKNLFFDISLLWYSVRTNRNVLAEQGRLISHLVRSIQSRVESDNEDREDLEHALAARAEMKQEGTVSWEDVKAKLGISTEDI